MKLKMIVTDLDGTLLHSDKELTERTVQTLQKCRQKGILLAIATARFWIGAESYINRLSPDYSITTDGTMVHRDNEMIYGCGFDIPTTNLLLKLIKEADSGAGITVSVGQKVYWNSHRISESKKLHKAIFNDYESPLTEPAYKIVTTLPSKDVAEEIAQKASCKVISYRGRNLYGFIHKEAGKLPALNSLAKRLHIPMEEIAAFGDDENDIDMLKACGLGVAVSNALPDVVEAADQTTLSNEEDGVADFIERSVLI